MDAMKVKYLPIEYTIDKELLKLIELEEFIKKIWKKL